MAGPAPPPFPCRAPVPPHAPPLRSPPPGICPRPVHPPYPTPPPYPRASEAPAEPCPHPRLRAHCEVSAARSSVQRRVVSRRLDMACWPQPDACLLGSPLGLTCLSLLIPAAGAAPRPAPASPGPSSSRPPVSGVGVAGSSRGGLTVPGLSPQPGSTVTAAWASAVRPSSRCWWCWWASAPAASSPWSSWWWASCEPRGACAPRPGDGGGPLPALGPGSRPQRPPGRTGCHRGWAQRTQTGGLGEMWGASGSWSPACPRSHTRLCPPQ